MSKGADFVVAEKEMAVGSEWVCVEPVPYIVDRVFLRPPDMVKGYGEHARNRGEVPVLCEDRECYAAAVATDVVNEGGE